jgi:TonB family protein
MSSANSVSTSAQSRRRFYARRKMEGLIYVDLGPENGGILIDVGEGGLGFQSVAPVSLDQAVLLKFKVPGGAEPLEGFAEIAWLNESGKGGGLRFVELSENARSQIRSWTGKLEAPEPGALAARNGAEPQVAQETAAPESSANVTEAGATPEAVKTGDTPAEILESFSEAVKTQPSGPATADRQADDAVHERLHAAESAYDGVPTAGNAPPVASTSEIGEFLMELTSHAGELLIPTPLSIDLDLAVPVAPVSNTHPVDAAASGSPQVAEQNRAADDAVDAAASENSAGGISEIAKTSPHLEETVAPVSNSEMAARLQAASASEPSARPAAIPRPSDVAREIPQPWTATPAKPARAQSSDFRNLAQTSKRPRKPSSSKPESSLPPAYRQDSGARGAFGRQSPKPAPAGTEWENLPDAQEEDFKPHPTLLSQALKIGIGAGAAACLLLVLVFAVPFLRTLVQTTANARSAGSNLANAPAFQVEVADISNRRWILRSGGDAGSPFSDTPSRRETQSAASNASRKESAQSSRSDDSDASTETEKAAAPQLKLAKPAELALSRPLAKPADAPAAQLVAPSIFDGITPPIGSLIDRMPSSGPDMPGIVSPASPVTNRAATLQSAVLMQRVPPIYPSPALQARIQGEVSVNATIGTDGVPKDLKLIKGDERLVAAALVAIRQWRYRPATLGGAPIETQTIVTVSFELK